MFCSNCGKELEAGDLFCGYCGVRQEPAQATQENPAVEEPAAGNEGPAVGDAAQGTQEGPAAPEAAAGKSLVGWVLAGVVMVIVLIAALSNGTPPSRREPPISVRVSNTLQKDTTKEVESDNAGLRVVTGAGAAWGVHSVKQYFDSAGNMIRHENYGADGHLKEGARGMAIFEYEYDSAGNLTREAYYGADGRLKEGARDMAIFEYEYDSAGNKIRQEHYGVDGRLKKDYYGGAIYEFEYDSAGNEVDFRAYDTQGRLTEWPAY